MPFWCRADDVYEEQGNPLLMTRLSYLLDQLQRKDHTLHSDHLTQMQTNLRVL
jgi:hypothetical protein